MELTRRGFLRGLFGTAAVGAGAAPYVPELAAKATAAATGAPGGLWMYRSTPVSLPAATLGSVVVPAGQLVEGTVINYHVRVVLLGQYRSVVTVE